MLGSWPDATALPAVHSAPSPTNSDLDPVLSCRMTTKWRHVPPPAGRCCPHLISGNSLYWWNGGGEGSVHSSVVAPAPHGLSAARSLRMNAWATPKKNTSAPNPERSDPSEETRFQPANASG